MMTPRFVLFGALLMQLAYQAHAMKCQLPMGLELSCPTVFNDNDKAFCCHSSENVPYCCDIGDYIQNNSAVIAGILVGALILLIVVTLCCCCFCSCCLLAKRRVQRGTILYG